MPVNGVESVTQFEPSAYVTFTPDTEGYGGHESVWYGSRANTTMRSATSGVGGVGSLGLLVEEVEESTMGSATGGIMQSQHGMNMKTWRWATTCTKRKTNDDGTSMWQGSTERKKKVQKPVSQVVTRVDIAQSQVHVRPWPPTKKKDDGLGRVTHA